jgi:hypothetical protein
MHAMSTESPVKEDNITFGIESMDDKGKQFGFILLGFYFIMQVRVDLTE